MPPRRPCFAFPWSFCIRQRATTRNTENESIRIAALFTRTLEHRADVASIRGKADALCQRQRERERERQRDAWTRPCLISRLPTSLDPSVSARARGSSRIDAASKLLLSPFYFLSRPRQPPFTKCPLTAPPIIHSRSFPRRPIREEGEGWRDLRFDLDYRDGTA